MQTHNLQPKPKNLFTIRAKRNGVAICLNVRAEEAVAGKEEGEARVVEARVVVVEVVVVEVAEAVLLQVLVLRLEKEESHPLLLQWVALRKLARVPRPLMVVGDIMAEEQQPHIHQELAHLWESLPSSSV
ncbi:hypothetical protein BOTCAL_0044g00250 [Botryotinia calthae]|uniref:Uncharacterized protein n=1 Tax=Botryotinia calthae TaxID=38488 RepID=A0A4Y8DBM7_9HELO|nr:hypothetical protein BOTCAL_0044g00250 [Botryotinia calthae]